MWQKFLHFIVDQMWAVLLNRWFERLISVLGFAIALIIAFWITLVDFVKAAIKRKAG